MKKTLLILALTTGVFVAGQWIRGLAARADESQVATLNGDTNGDGDRDLTDAIVLLNFLFQGGAPPVAFASHASSPCPSPPALAFTLNRSVLENVDNGPGRWQFAGGTAIQGSVVVGQYSSHKRVTFGVTSVQNTASLTLTICRNTTFRQMTSKSCQSHE